MSFREDPIVIEYGPLPDRAWIIVDAGGEQVTAPHRRDHWKYYRTEQSALNSIRYYKTESEWRDAALRPQEVTITVERHP